MPGTVATVGVLAAGVLFGASLLSVGTAAAWSQRLAGAADAAALAAADAASGAVAGVPCERAAQVGATVGAEVIACELDGLVATVTLGATYGVLPVSAAARAGPPPAAP
ncbi:MULTISPECIES: Rv3654c family TadE-like protein [unclassified Microbacterium]|uniref:Rv3654c family TadE-like protein n=1 Tax=unclassified Microbacterium TaxID=2609290 RepID=UPI00214AD984|nr:MULTISPECIES: Rv3654c family TadE-like protein [unclassified Microbacterium]MCR2783989.1 helicase [Microbacterium sp. zg.B96]WIM15168.1 helicase [Microbacterium sp. zg-B96]